MSRNSSIMQKASSENAVSMKTSEATMEQKYKICPYGCCKTESITGYVFQKGFMEGLYSDVRVNAFGKSYKLHKLFLERSP